ncbi:DUF2804 family protein [Nocardioides sp. DS6]|uniref:DUF2804 family protein n=1 Tax=Nocardioides eburneus TaxID=3231482 RepID=A0ABV3T1U4_9ACTN
MLHADRPVALVVDGHRHHGRFAARPADVNPLDAYAGLRRGLAWLRLKQWIGWTLLHPELSSSFILQDAHYLASSEIYVRDAQGLVEHARNARGGSLRLPRGLFPSSPRIGTPGYEIGYTWADEPAGTHRIRAEIAATAEKPRISVDLSLDGARASAPLSVSAPLPGGALYTHKAVFPAAGTVTVGERVHRFDPGRDLAILDEHHSALPYRTRWRWGTFATQASDAAPGGILGANLAERPTVPGFEDESCLWLPGPDGPTVEPLGDLTFEPSADDPLAPWHVSSADRRLDVTFLPEDRKSVKHQLVLAEIDYWQLVGTYTGVVAGRPVAGVRGVLESTRARL